MMVTHVQIDDVIEIFEIRRSLDVLALELFMRTNRPAIVAQMWETVDTMKTVLDGRDFMAFVHADNRFHELYSHNTGNQQLEKILVELAEQEQRILALTLNDLNRCKMSYQPPWPLWRRWRRGTQRRPQSFCANT